MTTLLIITLVLALLLAAGRVFVKSARKPIKRSSRLHIDDELVTVNEQMARLLKPVKQ